MASYTSVPYMGKMHGNHGGIIINVSSLAGVIGGNSLAPVYTASKFGVVGFSRAACNERLMAENGINICVICPWVVETRIKVISRQPDDVNSIYLNSRTIMPAEVANAVVGMIEDNCNGSVKLLMPGRAPIE
uniref:15-hydroxyprostaglandin dehydrogenase [NAD(+)] n=1 Tax=Saccoglossus kowalevskii TaxID=10224 RepID=A0ABM0LY46_SACKO